MYNYFIFVVMRAAFVVVFLQLSRCLLFTSAFKMDSRRRQNSLFEPSGSTDTTMNRPRRVFSTEEVIENMMDDESEERDLNEMEYDIEGSDIEEEVDSEDGESGSANQDYTRSTQDDLDQMHQTHLTHQSIGIDLSTNWTNNYRRRGQQQPEFS